MNWSPPLIVLFDSTIFLFHRVRFLLILLVFFILDHGECALKPAGVPIFNYSSDYGFGFGLISALYDDAESEIPYKRAYKLKFLITTKGKHKHYFNYDEPKIFDTSIRFNTTLQFKYIPYENYFGIGNDVEFNENYTNESGEDFVGERYYSYKLLQPSLDSNFLFPIVDRLSLLLGYHFLYSDIGTYSLSLLAEDNETGIGRSKVSGLKLGFLIDFRDNEPSPTRGTFSEISTIISESILGSDFDMARIVASTKNYLSIHKNLVYAFRILFKTDFGNAPFYEFSQSGGYMPITGLGGEESLRGFAQNRFIDRTHFLINNELRYSVATVMLEDNRFDSSLILFFDSGRVFGKPSDFEIDDLSYGGGFGLCLAWNKNFVIRGDAGFSREGSGLYIGFGHIF